MSWLSQPLTLSSWTLSGTRMPCISRTTSQQWTLYTSTLTAAQVCLQAEQALHADTIVYAQNLGFLQQSMQMSS